MLKDYRVPSSGLKGYTWNILLKDNLGGFCKYCTFQVCGPWVNIYKALSGARKGALTLQSGFNSIKVILNSLHLPPRGGRRGGGRGRRGGRGEGVANFVWWTGGWSVYNHVMVTSYHHLKSVTYEHWQLSRILPFLCNALFLSIICVPLLSFSNN